jgi:hypothetical protein
MTILTLDGKWTTENLRMKTEAFRKKLALILLHPFALTFLNLSLLILAYTGIKFTWFGLNPENHFHEATELWEGFGTILLGFGVILEERSTLRKILGITFPAEHPIEVACHDYGVFFVIFGVIIETFAWLVKIPNGVLDTYAFEFSLVNGAAFVTSLGVILQLRFFWRIHFYPKG